MSRRVASESSITWRDLVSSEFNTLQPIPGLFYGTVTMYLGFSGNEFQSEALVGALPVGQNNPQVPLKARILTFRPSLEVNFQM
jgi:hypothetical protein